MDLNNHESKILAIIPARGGSKRIPKKNIIDLCGKPLIYYSIREAHKSKMITSTIVSTDDPEIAEISIKLGADVPFIRPKEYSGDNSRDIDFLKHALDWIRKNRNWSPDIVVFLPPTTPSRTSEDIDEALMFMIKENADSVRTMVHPYHFNPFKMWVEDGENNRVKHLFPEYKNGVNRSDLKKYFMPISAVYATKSKCIDEGNLWGNDTRFVNFPMDRFVDIDNIEDIDNAKKVMVNFNLL